MNNTLTLEQRYTTIYIFLGKQYYKTLSDDLGSLLGNMSTLQNGRTMDPATWSEWTSLKHNPTKASLAAEQTYQIMVTFLKYYIDNGFDELQPLLKEIKKTYEDNTHNPELWNEWLDAVKEAPEKGIEATRLKAFKNYDNYANS